MWGFSSTAAHSGSMYVCVVSWSLGTAVYLKHKRVVKTSLIEHFSLLLRVACHYRSRDSSLQQLPGTWMHELLDMLQSATVSQSLSFTRRSAGLPFFIQVSETVQL